MFNSNDLNKLSYNLEEILETPVSIKLLESLRGIDRASLTSLIYRWTRGEKVEERVKSILNKGKEKMPVKKYSPTTEAYLKIKKQQYETKK